MPQQWLVVGGEASGGIMVREGEKTSSNAIADRLAKGAVVEQLALKGDRLNYKLLEGNGPAEGWVSIKIKSNVLLQKHGEIVVEEWQPIPDDVWKKLPKLADHPNLFPKTLKEWKAIVNTVDKGEYWGIDFPISPAMLKEWGPEWLTKAMHAAGTLDKDNAITKILEWDVKAEDVTKQDAENAKWGGAGCKILFSVEYKNGGTEAMFGKMPHEFIGGKNERQKNSFGNGAMMDWSEVTFANLLGGRFGSPPFRIPKMYFCDICRKTTNFINIVERIPYAPTGTMVVNAGEWYPAPEKYRDWALPNNGIDLYYAHAKAIARFFAWDKNMRAKTNQIDHSFGNPETLAVNDFVFNAMKETGPYNSKQRDAKLLEWMTKDPQMMGFVAMKGMPQLQCKGFLDMADQFITETAPQAFPEELRTKAYLARFNKEGNIMSYYVPEMNFYINAQPEYFGLTHPNAQVDNAFYWKDEAGDIQCGLLDWGGANHADIPTCLGNGWMGSEPELFAEHEEKLVKVFVDEYEREAGFRFDCDHLHMSLKLAQGAVFYGCCANLGRCLQIHKKDVWKEMKGRKDPKIDENFLLRCYFVQVHLWLKMWGLPNSPYVSFTKWMKRINFPPKAAAGGP